MPSFIIIQTRLHPIATFLSTYDGSLEGKTVYVLAGVGGKIESAKAVVEDGRVHMDLGHLGKDKSDYGWTPFVIITEEEYNNLRNGNEL